jgi:hypothetical protein
MKSESAESPSINIGKAQREILRREFKRTGMTAIRLMSEATDAPEGLNSSHINRWISGLLKQVIDLHLEYVLCRLKGMADDAGLIGPGGKSVSKRGRRADDGAIRIPVTDKMAERLRAELVRTALDHATLLQGVADIPAGLNPRIIRGWLYKDALTTNTAYWSFVIEHLARQPDFTGALPVPIRKSRKPKASE